MRGDNISQPSERNKWEYQEQSGTRDERIDFLRGLTIMVVIVNHNLIPSLFQIFTVEAIGVVTGAECFVFLSGYVTGFIYNRRIKTLGMRQSSLKLLHRAFQIYAAAVVSNTIIYLLQQQPVIDSQILTTYTNIKTGTVYYLYGDGRSAVRLIVNILILNYGPSQTNILGLYVILIAAAPLLFLLLKNGYTSMVITMSWILYTAGVMNAGSILPMQSERAFPVLVWQLLFVHGVVMGYHKNRIMEFFASREGKLLFKLMLMAFVFLCFFALNNPWYRIPLNMRLGIIPERYYSWIYSHFFERTILGTGRFFNTLIVLGVLFAFLNKWWEPCRRLLGWLLIPLGRATLYIFIVHVIFVMLIHNIEILNHGNLLINTAAQVAAVLSIWFMVQKKVLFGIIPR